MNSIEGVEFVQGDIMDRQTLIKIHRKFLKIHKIQENSDTTTIQQTTQNKKPVPHDLFDAVVSDMAPNFSGQFFETHRDIVDLNRMAIYTCARLLKPFGNLVMKSLHGELEKTLIFCAEFAFEEVKKSKPQASRDESSEYFIVCKGLKGNRRMHILENLMEIELRASLGKSSIEDILSRKAK